MPPEVEEFLKELDAAAVENDRLANTACDLVDVHEYQSRAHDLRTFIKQTKKQYA